MRYLTISLLRRGHGRTWARMIVLGTVLTVFCDVRKAATFHAEARPAGSAALMNLTQYVDPMIGTATAAPSYNIGNEGGHVFPGAVLPRGMIQWSPDTTDLAGGYRYEHNAIDGFSLTHFSGRGCKSYQDIPIMPELAAPRGSLTLTPVAPANFTHARETASPGYYAVRLNNGIGVQLAVTQRTGIGVFSFPLTATPTVSINAGGSAMGDAASGTRLEVVGNSEVDGAATSGNFCGSSRYTVYFALQFARPFSSGVLWQGTRPMIGASATVGAQSKAWLTFTTHQVLARVGISFVSVAGARLNLATEQRGWDFESVRDNALRVWNRFLNHVQVTGGAPEQLTEFYTALYHIQLHPNVFSDVNGDYMGFDRQVHKASGYTQYDNFPGWDNYRSLMPLNALLFPRETSDMMQSLVMDARQGGGGLPRWQVANDNSGGMVGDSQDIVIASAYAFGARNFDLKGALRAMIAGASDVHARSGGHPPREGLAYYLRLGYVPEGAVAGSASITLEYVADDFAISTYARALGDSRDATLYARRAGAWRKLFDLATQSIVPRDAQGNFMTQSPTSMRGFVEGDGAQYTWLVPYDLPALFKAMGGDARAVVRLNQHFVRLNDGPASSYAFMGNEPEFAVPWEYDFAGAAYSTQDVVRRILSSLFHATAGGLPGNDDGGAMSSWYIFAALGMYPEVPGVAGYALTSPLFRSALIHLENGKTISITANASTANRYVQGLHVGDAPYTSALLPFGSLAHGGTLHYELGTTPSASWGRELPPVVRASALSMR